MNENLHKVDTYVEELSEGMHFGDCTSVPCSCMKCYAEYLLDFSTLSLFSKSSVYKIGNVFAKNPDFTIDEAIDFLGGQGYVDYISTPNENWKDKNDYMKWVPTWVEQAKVASEQLKQYKEKYFMGTMP